MNDADEDESSKKVAFSRHACFPLKYGNYFFQANQQKLATSFYPPKLQLLSSSKVSKQLGIPSKL